MLMAGLGESWASRRGEGARSGSRSHLPLPDGEKRGSGLSVVAAREGGEAMHGCTALRPCGGVSWRDHPSVATWSSSETPIVKISKPDRKRP